MRAQLALANEEVADAARWIQQRGLGVDDEPTSLRVFVDEGPRWPSCFATCWWTGGGYGQAPAPRGTFLPA